MAATAEPAWPVGLLLSDDLIFTSRITGTARSQGFTVHPAPSAAQLESLAQQHTPRCVILDLGHPTLKVAELVARLKASSPVPQVVAYGSHVDTATLRAAREAGCDVVLPRSKFVEDLSEALPRWMGLER
jgi:CheY-like chemotaxis protein